MAKDVDPKRRGRPAPTRIQIDADWFRDRIEQLRLSHREVAAALMRDPAILSRTLAGGREFDARDVVNLAQVLRVSADEILQHMGYEVAQSGVPVVGRITPDGRISHITTRRGQTITAQVGLGSQALIFECPSGPLQPYHGAAVVYTPPSDDIPVPPDAIGRLCIVEADDHVTPVLGTLARASERGRVRLTVFGTGEEMSVSKLHSASMISAIFLA